MKRPFVLLASAAMISLGASLAVAQGTTIELAPEVRTQFHEHVTTTQIAPAEVQAELVVGTAVPADVQLHPVPPVILERTPELEGHMFFVVDNRIHVVHPDSRQIVTIID